MELLNSAAYCCNQATSMDENQLNEIYARKLHDYNNNSNNQHKVEEILLEFLASNTDKYDRTVREIFNCFSYYEKSKKMPEECNELRIVNVGNKSTRKPESIDYSTMPLVTNTATLPDKELFKSARVIANKRKTISDDYDETDSSFDHKLIASKRFKCTEISSEDKSHAVIYHTEMTEAQLWKLTNTYSCLNDYKQLALGLGLEENDVSVIDSKHLIRDGIKECFYQCLLTWRLQVPENCSLATFFRVLIERLEKSDQFIADFKQRLSSSDSEKTKTILGLYAAKHGVEYEKIKAVKLAESHLWEASSIMAREWRTIGRVLGLSELDLSSIEVKYLFTDGIRECCYQMLLLWLECSYDQADLECLCMGLIDMKLNLFAKQIIEKLVYS